MRKNIAVLPGDGVGPEIIEQAVKVLRKIGELYHHDFSFQYGLIGAEAIDKTGNPLPDESLKLCQKSDAVLFGAIGDPKYDSDPSAKIRPEQGLLKLRKSLGLFANIRPVKVYPQLLGKSPLKREIAEGVDFIVIRELTGGIYFGEPRIRKDNGTTAIDTSLYTVREIERIARVAFALARKRKKKIVSVDKANVLETSRLWRETVSQVGKEYPDVELSHMFVDNTAMQIMKNPKQFDVILTENMFGDILTDEASVIAGSIGLLPSASISYNSQPTTHNSQPFFGLYEPIHGAYNKATGKNTANPIGTILSATMLLRLSFGLEKEAQAAEKAVHSAFEGGFRTKDIATNNTAKEKILGTKEMGDAISMNF